MKTCSKCGRMRPVSDYYKQSGNVCKTCRKEYQHEYHAVSRKNAIAKAAQWNKDHPERHRQNCLNYYYRLQDKALLAYGGYECACCGTKIRVFLTLDHTDNDGHEHRKKLGYFQGAALYKWLKENGYPPGFQVLCYNCNYGKHRNHGVCPHKDLSSGLPSTLR